MELKILISDTEIIPKVKLEKFEFDILKMSKDIAEKVIDAIVQQGIQMHMEMMIKKLKEETDGKD